MTLSAVVITYNEERNIGRCLESLSFADEIVVLDSFSTDRTVEIARGFTDRVFQRKFAGFSEQWAQALTLASCDWVLIVGADEEITRELADEIVQAVRSGDRDGYRIPRITEFVGRHMRHCGWFPDYQLRLARRSKACYTDRLVHESLEVDGTVGTLRGHILHHSHPDLDTFTRKMTLYTRLAAAQKMREGRRFRVTDLLVAPVYTFFKTYVIKRGFLDGWHGFVLSVLLSAYSALRYSMLWEMTLRERSGKEQLQ